jgi:AcrR family transcriptional regulator
MQSMSRQKKPTSKGEETRDRILDVALALFKKKGYDATTMREIAAKAGLATGAAYRHFPSKVAFVMAYYERTFEGLRPKVEWLLNAPGSLEDRVRNLVNLKFQHFGPGRTMLRGMLRCSPDVNHAVSPFSKATTALREMEIGWFQRILSEEGLGLPHVLERQTAEMLWAMHIGMMLCWCADESPGQAMTARVLGQGLSTIVALLRLTDPASISTQERNIVNTKREGLGSK